MVRVAILRLPRHARRAGGEALPGRLGKNAARVAGPGRKVALRSPIFLRKMLKFMDLLNGAADRGKDVVGIRSDQPDGADDYREDDGQHDRIFGNVLPCFFPQAPQKTHHV